MIRITILNNNKMIVDTSKTTKIEKKEYAKKNRYVFIKKSNGNKKH